MIHQIMARRKKVAVLSRLLRCVYDALRLRANVLYGAYGLRIVTNKRMEIEQNNTTNIDNTVRRLNCVTEPDLS